MRFEIAGYVFDCLGCDDMHNHALFAPFRTDKAHTDCRIRVIDQTPQYPPLDDAEKIGDWKRIVTEGNTTLCHRSGALMLTITPALTDVEITMSMRMTNADLVRYMQVQQAIGGFLVLHGGGLLHSAGVQVEKNAILLCGKSGVGKSTMARCLCDVDPQATILCEEMPAVMDQSDRYTVYGTPLCGDGDACVNRQAPLSFIVLLRQAPQNRLTVPSKDIAVFELLSVLMRPSYLPQVGTAATDLTIDLIRRVPIVVFENDGTPEAAEHLIEYLRSETRDCL